MAVPRFDFSFPTGLQRRRGNVSESVRKWFGNGPRLTLQFSLLTPPRAHISVPFPNCRTQPFPNYFRTISRLFLNRFRTAAEPRLRDSEPPAQPKISPFFELILPRAKHPLFSRVNLFHSWRNAKASISACVFREINK